MIFDLNAHYCIHRMRVFRRGRWIVHTLIDALISMYAISKYPKQAKYGHDVEQRYFNVEPTSKLQRWQIAVMLTMFQRWNIVAVLTIGFFFTCFYNKSFKIYTCNSNTWVRFPLETDSNVHVFGISKILRVWYRPLIRTEQTTERWSTFLYFTAV